MALWDLNPLIIQFVNQEGQYEAQGQVVNVLEAIYNLKRLSPPHVPYVTKALALALRILVDPQVQGDPGMPGLAEAAARWVPVALTKFTELSSTPWRAALSNDLFKLKLKVPEALLHQYAYQLQSSVTISDPLTVLLSSPLVQKFSAVEHLTRAVELAGPMGMKGYVTASGGYVSDATPYLAPPALLVLTKGFPLELIPYVAKVSGALGEEMKGQALQEELAWVLQQDPNLLKQLWGPNGSLAAVPLTLASLDPITAFLEGRRRDMVGQALEALVRAGAGVPGGKARAEILVAEAISVLSTEPTRAEAGVFSQALGILPKVVDTLAACFSLDWWDIGLRLDNTYHQAPDWAGSTGRASVVGMILHSKALARNAFARGPLATLLRRARDGMDASFLLTPLSGYCPLAAAVMTGYSEVVLETLVPPEEYQRDLADRCATQVNSFRKLLINHHPSLFARHKMLVLQFDSEIDRFRQTGDIAALRGAVHELSARQPDESYFKDLSDLLAGDLAACCKPLAKTSQQEEKALEDFMGSRIDFLDSCCALRKAGHFQAPWWSLPVPPKVLTTNGIGTKAITKYPSIPEIPCSPVLMDYILADGGRLLEKIPKDVWQDFSASSEGRLYLERGSLCCLLPIDIAAGSGLFQEPQVGNRVAPWLLPLLLPPIGTALAAFSARSRLDLGSKSLLHAKVGQGAGNAVLGACPKLQAPPCRSHSSSLALIKADPSKPSLWNLQLLACEELATDAEESKGFLQGKQASEKAQWLKMAVIVIPEVAASLGQLAALQKKDDGLPAAAAKAAASHNAGVMNTFRSLLRSFERLLWAYRMVAPTASGLLTHSAVVWPRDALFETSERFVWAVGKPGPAVAPDALSMAVSAIFRFPASLGPTAADTLASLAVPVLMALVSSPRASASKLEGMRTTVSRSQGRPS